MGHGEREDCQEYDLQQVEEEAVHVELCSKLEPLLIEQCDHQGMLEQTLALVLCLEGELREYRMFKGRGCIFLRTTTYIA